MRPAPVIQDKPISHNADSVLEFRTQKPENVNDSMENVKLDDWLPTALTGKYLSKVSLESAPTSTGESQMTGIRMKFNAQGKELLAKITRENIGKPVAIFINGKFISAPNVAAPITGGEAVIWGYFSMDQANEMVSQMNSSIAN